MISGLKAIQQKDRLVTKKKGRRVSTLEGSLELGSLLGILHDEGDEVAGSTALELDAVLVLLDLDNYK